MSRHSVVVLKFGGSILSDDTSVNSVLNTIYSFVRSGKKVIAVVSAFGNHTDELTKRALRISPSPDPEAFASLLATGESVSASLLSLAADNAGIECRVLGYERLGIRTEGEAIDSHPVSVDFDEWESTFDTASLVVVPGFIGLTPKGGPSLLGRGGSDLTALFLAAEVKAERCVLYKDVGGWYVDDPKVNPNTEVYDSLSWDDALAACVDVVQSKAVSFSASLRQSFEVTGLRSRVGTRVGAFDTVRAKCPVQIRKIPVVVAGAGTVGSGVLSFLELWDEVYSVKKILVKVADKDREWPEELITTDPAELAEIDDAILIECTGDLDVGNYLATSALLKGRHVVTAGKELVARHGARLSGLADSTGCTFQYSASVGGGVPMLEFIDGDKEISVVRGVVNGTCNFVADLVRDGQQFDDAVKLAQENGYAEADPQADLSGMDSVYKLVLLSQKAFGVWTPINNVQCRGFDETSFASGQVVRLVGAAILSDDNEPRLEVSPQILDPVDPLYDVQGVRNALQISYKDGSSKLIFGRGAGRWPTALSVFGDLLETGTFKKSANDWEEKEAA